MITGVGRDINSGGAGSEIIHAFSSSGGVASQDGNNIFFGDYGLVDYLSEELAQGSATNPSLEAYVRGASALSAAGNPVRAADIDRVWSIESATGLGGDDTITTGDRNDIIIGGRGSDRIVSGRGDPGTGRGADIVISDNGKVTADDTDNPNTIFAVHEFTVCTIETIGFADIDGGDDTIVGSDLNDVYFGGGGNDVIYAGAGSDLVFGDNGKVACANGQFFDPQVSLPPIALELGGFLAFEALNVASTTGAGNDLIYGQQGNDVLMGQQGNDVLDGGVGDDILIGGSNVAGALDGNDRIDGGVGSDVIAGDNANIYYRPDQLDVRMRALDGTLIYGTAAGVNDGLGLISSINPANPFAGAQNDPRVHAQYLIRLLDHDDTVAQQSDPAHRFWGNDYLAGGAGEDDIFGELGNDIIQGDGKIGTDPRTDLTIIAFAGAPTDFTAFRDGSSNTDTSLVVRASFESASDGDDYI